MIYVSDINEPARMRFPRTLADTPADPVLEIISTVGRIRHEAVVTDIDAGALYIDLTADLSGISTPGEHEYLLIQGETVLASGIMRIGPLPEVRPVEYIKTPIYEQY